MVVLRVCGGCDLLVDYVHLEDFCSVVCEHSTVKEELRQSEVNHPVVVADHRVDCVVRQSVVRITQVEKHPLQTQHTLSLCHNNI